MILFNGRTGGLGRFLQGALEKIGLQGYPLNSRLEDIQSLCKELEKVASTSRSIDKKVTLIQMAAMVPVALCEKNPSQAFKTNVTDTLETVLTFVRWAHSQGLTARVFYMSTGHVYAPQSAGTKTVEQDAVAPRSLYARTKLEAENHLRSLSRTHDGFDLLIGRIFGLLSPEQTHHYVLPGLLHRIKERHFAHIPGLEYYRDYLDARDVCQHIGNLCQLEWDASELRSQPIANICSGEPLCIKDLLLEILDVVNIERSDIMKQLTAAPGRPDDIPWNVGNPLRLCHLTNRPARQTPLRDTIVSALKNADFSGLSR